MSVALVGLEQQTVI